MNVQKKLVADAARKAKLSEVAAQKKAEAEAAAMWWQCGPRQPNNRANQSDLHVFEQLDRTAAEKAAAEKAAAVSAAEQTAAAEKTEADVLTICPRCADGGVSIYHEAQSVDVSVAQHLADTASSAAGADGTYRRLWPAALRFAKWLGDHPETVRGKSVLELGAGTGAIGLVCAALGATRVCITDVPGALQPIRDSVRLNPALGGSVSVAPCTWGLQSHLDALLAAGERFDVVIGCEVVYKQEWAVLSALLETMDALLGHGRSATILLAYKPRAGRLEDSAFFGPASERFRVEQVPISQRVPPHDAGKCAASESGATAQLSEVHGPPDDDGLSVFCYTRVACLLPGPPLLPTAPAAAEEDTRALLVRLGLAHLQAGASALADIALDDLAQAVLDDRPGLLARLRAAGVASLGERQRIANVLTRVARARRLQ